MKVLYTASTASHILRFHVPYLRWFKERGFTIHVACGGEKCAIPYTDEVLFLPFEKRMVSLKNLQAASMLRRKIRSERYTLMITHTSLAAFFPASR